MKYTRYAFLIFFLFSCVSTKHALSPQERVLKEEKWRYDLPRADNTPQRPLFPNLQEKTLKNGLRIYVIEDHRLPITDVALVFKNGSSLDPIGKAGLNNLVALMLKEGTEKLSSLELSEAFANIGTHINVGAGKDSAFLSVGILSKKINKALGLMSSMAQRPRFSQEDFSRLKIQQQHAISSEMASPAYVAQVRFLQAAYGPKHPYGYPTIGTALTLAQINLPDIKNAHKNNFGPNNAALIVAGDVSLKNVVRMAKRHFASWKKIKDPLIPLEAPIKNKEMQTILIPKASMPQTFLLLGQPVATRHDEDLATYEVLQNILAGMPTSRLGLALRERKGWTYGVYSTLNAFRGVGPLWINTSIQIPYGADALKHILEELDTLKTTLVSPAELEMAKSGLLNSFASRYTTLNKLVFMASEQFIYNLPKNYDEIFYDRIAQVSPEMIRNAAHKAFQRENFTAVAVGDPEVMNIPLSSMKVGKIIIER
jgi:zinc protease